jgi:hypothetical protein
MRRPEVWAILGLLIAAPFASAQNNGVNEQSFFTSLPLGRGARAWGMGGAEIAAPGPAGPATANPAGLAGTERPAVAVVFGYDNLRLEPGQRSQTASAPPYVARATITQLDSGTSGSALDFAGVAFRLPVRVGAGPLVLRAAYERAVSMARTLDYSYQFRSQSSYRFDYDFRKDVAGGGGLDRVTVSAAITPVRGLSIGVNVHRWFGGYSAATTENYDYSVADYYGWTGTWHEQTTDALRFDLAGFSADVGLVATLRPWLSLGLVYRSPASLDAEYSDAPTRVTGLTHEQFSSSSAGTGVIELPASFGAGVGARAGKLLLAGDLVWTRWSAARFDHYARANADGGTSLPADYFYPSMAATTWTWQASAGQGRFGVEYPVQLGGVEVPLRGGLFVTGDYAPDLDGNFRTAVGVTAGAGVVWHHVGVDGAWVRLACADAYVRNSVRATLRVTF